MPASASPDRLKWILCAVFAALFIAAFSLAPQIYLWSEKGSSWNGVWALNDYDELAYAAYIQSLIDGKPRINSPYTGTKADTGPSVKESLFSIQFFAFYPIAWPARLLGLSSSTAMILMTAVTGFLWGLALFWLLDIFIKNPLLSAAGTMAVFASGALVAGQGSLVAGYVPSEIFYYIAFPSARRAVPAMGYPALFLFFAFVWKFLDAGDTRAKAAWGTAAVLAFISLIFTYFYLWTTAAAWFAAVVALFILFREKNQKSQLGCPLLLLGLVMCASLIPYAILLTSRAESMDSAQLLLLTRQSDLWRVPEVLSFVAILGFIAARLFGLIGKGEPKIVFLLSFLLVPVMVFNQQIVTGRSLQPIHYEFFTVNYLVAFGLAAGALILVRTRVSGPKLAAITIFLILTAAFVSYSDAKFAYKAVGPANAARDELMPVSEKIKALSREAKKESTVISFDLVPVPLGQMIINCSDELPALSSQPVLWAPHQAAFSDLTEEQSVNRLFKFLYYQDLDPTWLQAELERGRSSDLTPGFFGWGRTSDAYTAGHEPVTAGEIAAVVDQYRKFREGFSRADAETPVISYLIAPESVQPNFAAVDKWYVRDQGEKVGKYMLYRLELR